MLISSETRTFVSMLPVRLKGEGQTWMDSGDNLQLLFFTFSYKPHIRNFIVFFFSNGNKSVTILKLFFFIIIHLQF